MATCERFKLVFTAPHAPLKAIKDAIFAVGAGTYPGAKYSRVCFQTPGLGQFLPDEQKGAMPHIGTPGTLETVEEMRVEILCVGRDVMLRAVDALKRYYQSKTLEDYLYICQRPKKRDRTHPYEEPAYEVYRIEDV